MNFDEYEKKHFRLYSEFAEAVRYILSRALEGTGVTPTTITCRAKDPTRLRARLEQAGDLDHQNIELVRRDLAGARIVLYTENDVTKLRQLQLLTDNFEVEPAKVHHPTKENDSRYQGIHYTVKLREDRTKLPEYAKFAGLRCEIQIQTALNHAWSETSHDIVYKGQNPPGFGTMAMQRFKEEFNSIMDRYLIPAGIALQAVQNDYERYLTGKQLFDADVVRQLDSAQNNNERFEILARLESDTVAHYDDHVAAFDQLREPLIRATRIARTTPTIPIPTDIGDVGGRTAARITQVVVNIFGKLRYADPVEALKGLMAIFREETDPDQRKHIVSVVKSLAEFSIPIWKRVGPGVQIKLIEFVNGLSDKDLAECIPIAMTVWEEALDLEMSGTTWDADSVPISTGTIGLSDTIKEMRRSVLAKLFREFDNAKDDDAKRAVLNALSKAKRTPIRGNYSEAHREITLDDTKTIVEFLTTRAPAMSLELLQHVEHELLWDYYRAR